YHIINGLSKHFRDLLMCQNDGTTKLLEVGAETEAKFHAQAKEISATFLLQALELTNNYALQYKSSLHPHLQVELCLMQIASLTEGEKKKPRSYIKPNEKVASASSATKDKITESPLLADNPALSADKPVETVTEPVETVTEPVEVTPIQLDLSAQGVSGLSLSSLRIQKEHQTKIVDAADEEKLNNHEIQQEALTEQWQNYTNQMTNKGERNMVALLQLDTPRLKNKTEIHLSVPNETNKLELEKNSSLLLQFLRKQLINDHLSLHVHVDVKEEKKFVYTAEDKYQELLKKNPMIETFKKNFNLEY
ncbi:MAG: DNA polymerase III subunit gamma/tau, partial [Flavobacteriaceae bacterium]